MAQSAAAHLRTLESLRLVFGKEAEREKYAFLDALGRARLPRAGEVARLHDLLLFIRAWPDSPRVRRLAEWMLKNFEARADLKRHRRVLADSGIAGTEIRYPFYHATADWLARKWGDHLAIDWDEFENADALEGLLEHLALDAEALGLDSADLSAREWIGRMRKKEESEAAFLLARFRALKVPDALRQKLYEDLDVPLCVMPGATTPARGRERFPAGKVVCQRGALDRGRDDFKRRVLGMRPRFRDLSPAAGQRVVDLAKGAMALRQRDLDAFAYADPRDVRLADCGGGAAIALIGMPPGRRHLLAALYGFLIFKNGVVVGYGTGAGLFGSCEAALNIFPAFRGGEAVGLLAAVLAAFLSLFGADTFSVDPYQLGMDNEEALRSGAWWFYANLGFRPRAGAALRLARAEIARRKKNPRHRTSRAALERLSERTMFLSLGRPRREALGAMELGPVGLLVTDYLAGRFGGDREKGERTCAKEEAALLGVRSLQGWSPGERAAWRRWAPLVMALPGLSRWPREELRALVGIIRAKGGRRESDFVHAFNAHPRLRRAIARLAKHE
ncbi:MAG: hypothetical protein O2807_10530 [bacterium]|nr:hypothetical protein [bacterium]